MSGQLRSSRGRQMLHRTWSVVTHLVDDMEPNRMSSVAPIGADGARVKIFSQNR